MSKKFPQLILAFVAISYSGVALAMLPPRGTKLPEGTKLPPQGTTFKTKSDCVGWCNKNNNTDRSGAAPNACIDVACMKLKLQ